MSAYTESFDLLGIRIDGIEMDLERGCLNRMHIAGRFVSWTAFLEVDAPLSCETAEVVFDVLGDQPIAGSARVTGTFRRPGGVMVMLEGETLAAEPLHSSSTAAA